MRSNIQLIRILETGNVEKTMGEKINNEIFKTISHNRGQEFAWLKGTHSVPIKMDKNRPLPRHIIMNFLNTGNKQKILQA